ncbi:MAG: CCA tRNA nucleotidyltransferase [Desulfatirhabdiaceae bacterium]
MIDLTIFEKYPFLSALKSLSSKDEPIYLVGGCVRDLLLGHDPEDFDLAVTGNPKRLAEKLAARLNGSLFRLGKNKAVVYRVMAGPHLLDVASLVGDGIASDLRQRDFTVNAMALDMNGVHLIDPCNGVADIRNHRIKMVSENAFINDPLRMLRAYRFAACLNFTMDAGTTDAIVRHANRITASAVERIKTEFFKLIATPTSLTHLMAMQQSGLLFAIFPELADMVGCLQNRHHQFDVMEHTWRAYQVLEQALNSRLSGLSPEIKQVISQWSATEKILFKCAMLFHDVGKPRTRTVTESGDVHFFEHEAVGAKMARDMCLRLKFANTETGFIESVITHHLRPLMLFIAYQKGKLTQKGITRFFLACGPLTPFVLMHVLADISGKNTGGYGNMDPDLSAFVTRLFNQYHKSFKPVQRQPRLVTGQDLMNLFGLHPSPLFKVILLDVEEARLSGDIHTREDGLKLAESLVHQASGR